MDREEEGDGDDTTVEIAHAFGSHCGTSLREPVLFGDEDGSHLVYPVGRQMGFRHIATGEMGFALESHRVEAVTACAVSRDRSLLASCERCSSETLTQVSIFDLKAVGARPVQTLEELGALVGRLVCVAFSPDSRTICLASASIEMLLVVLDWRLNKVLGKTSMTSPADRVNFSPLENELLSVSGPQYLQLYRLKDTELALTKTASELSDTSTIRDHAWLELGDGMLAVCMSEGKVIIWNAETSAVVNAISMPHEMAAAGAYSIKTFSRGLLVGGGNGCVAFWESVASQADTQNPELRYVRTARVRSKDIPIRSIDVAGPHADQQVVFGFSNGDIGTTTMSTIIDGRGDENLATLIGGGFHCGPITGLDMAVYRPIVASVCRKDASVRLWDYSARRCTLCLQLPPTEEPVSVALHPFGYFLAVSFVDKLRFFHVLVNELKPHRDLSVRGVKMLRFSHGGHLLAMAQGKLVLIFSVRTLSRLATLRGHSQQVTSLCWEPDDQVLASCGENGDLFEWNTWTWSKARDHVTRYSEFVSVSAGPDGHSCCSVVEGSRSFLRGFKDCKPQEDLELPGGMRLGAMVHLVQKRNANTPDATKVMTLFGGSSTGTLWTCPVPEGSSGPSSFSELGLHVGACTALTLSCDGRTLVTAGDDGAIFVLNILSVHAGHTENPGDKAADVVMIHRGEIQLRHEEFQLLHTDNSALRSRLTEESAKLESECRSRVTEARRKDQEEIQALRRRYETLQQGATAKERENLRVMKSTEAAHISAADGQEQKYDKRISQEAERFVNMEAELKQLAQKIERLQERSQSRLQQERQQQKTESQRRISEKDAEIQKLKDLIATTQQRFDMMLDQEGMEHDLEVTEMKMRSADELERHKGIEYKLKKEQDALLRGLDMMEKDRERIMKEQAEAKLAMNALSGQADQLAAQVKSLKTDRLERGATLREKELEIGTYKVKVNTLKKFKHVLDFRLREVTQSLQPKDNMIAQLSAELRELEAEFEAQLFVQKDMEVAIEKKTEEIDKVVAEGARLRGVIKSRERIVECFKEDLYNLVNDEQDVRRWPDEIRRIYHAHVNPMLMGQTEEEQLSMEELSRQKRLMERKVTTLTAKGERTEQACRADIQRKSHENSLLIREADELRIEKKVLNSKAKDYELRLMQAEKKLAELKERPPQVAIEDVDGTRRAATRVPSSDSLPVVRHGNAAVFTSAQRSPSLPPGGSAAGTRKGGSTATMSPDERMRMQNLVVTADLHNQQIQMQTLENRILLDQIEKLLQEPGAASSSTLGQASGTEGKPSSRTRSAGRVRPGDKASFSLSRASVPKRAPSAGSGTPVDERPLSAVGMGPGRLSPVDRGGGDTPQAETALPALSGAPA